MIFAMLTEKAVSMLSSQHHLRKTWRAVRTTMEMPLRNFPLEQLQDETPRHIFNQVTEWSATLDKCCIVLSPG